MGYVRDMFYFSLIDFAVFNVADAAISVGGVLLVADLLFSKKGKAFLAEFDKKEVPDAAKMEKRLQNKALRTRSRAETNGDG